MRPFFPRQFSRKPQFVSGNRIEDMLLVHTMGIVEPKDGTVLRERNTAVVSVVNGFDPTIGKNRNRLVHFQKGVPLAAKQSLDVDVSVFSKIRSAQEILFDEMVTVPELLFVKHDKVLERIGTVLIASNHARSIIRFSRLMSSNQEQTSNVS